MKVDLQAADDYLGANVSGRYTLGGMRGVIEKVAQCVQGGAPKRVLIDVSEMVGDASLLDRYRYASFAAERLQGVAKVAACAGKGQRVVPLTATVAQGRGLLLRVFRERSDALAWLRSPLPTTVNEYLDAVLAAHDLVNDSELARKLDIKSSRIANYRMGRCKPNRWMIARIASLLELSVGKVASDIATSNVRQDARPSRRRKARVKRRKKVL